MAAGCGWGDPGNVAEETVKVVTFCLPCLSNKMSFFIHLFTSTHICSFLNFILSYFILYTFVSLLEDTSLCLLFYFYFYI